MVRNESKIQWLLMVITKQAAKQCDTEVLKLYSKAINEKSYNKAVQLAQRLKLEGSWNIGKLFTDCK